jgi:hypothetical protein
MAIVRRNPNTNSVCLMGAQLAQSSFGDACVASGGVFLQQRVLNYSSKHTEPADKQVHESHFRGPEDAKRASWMHENTQK